MALVVNGIVRYTFEGTYLDRPWANILDIRIDTTGSPASRDGAIYDVAGHLMNCWADHIANQVVIACELDRVSWVDLNSVDGSTGSRSGTSENTAPIPGIGDGPPSGGNLAVLISKQVISSRGARNGRWFQVGIAETVTQGNILAPTNQTAWQTAFDAFLSAVNNDGIIVVATQEAVVVHTTGLNPTTGTFSLIEQMVVQSRLATQRRRLRG